MSQQLYVPTDARGTQYVGDDEIHWSLPEQAPDGVLQPGAPVAAGPGSPLRLFTLEGLFEHGFGERIFLARIEAASGAEVTGFGVECDAAHLLAETAWSITGAARLAVDCASHVLGDRAATPLAGGSSLGQVLEACRAWLEHADEDAGGVLGRVARLATARRLRKRGAEVGELAFALALVDEDEDLDTFDDPDWAAVAAARDAVLAAVEALRHTAFPHLVEDENVRWELDSGASAEPPEVVGTPWGNFMAGRRSGIVPAWVAARDAAERARQAAEDTGGAAAREAEASWQVERLAEALDSGSSGDSRPSGEQDGGAR